MVATFLKSLHLKHEPALELDDIQGLVVDHFRKKTAARYVLLHVQDTPNARGWLGKLVSDLEITNALTKDPSEVVNVAFTHAGLKALWPDQSAFPKFNRAFMEGMVTEHRSRALGDEGKSDPKYWVWGGRDDETNDHDSVHLLLILFTDDDKKVSNLKDRLLPTSETTGLVEIAALATEDLHDSKEHFGFREVGAQPLIKGLAPDDGSAHQLPAGEFILGYRNLFNQYPVGVYLEEARRSKELLPADPEKLGKRDFGKNGTYLVYRQLVQHVNEFWSYLNLQTDNNPKASIALAAKMVGRWPSGAPLARFPEADPGQFIRGNNFSYAADPHGYAVPKTAHIRRANRRDSITESPERSFAISNEHRLIRRGRSFGRPVADSMATNEILAAEKDDIERGLHFICLNADIGRQFEFVQRAYLNHETLGGSYGETDPLSNKVGVSNAFSAPGWPIRKRYTGLQSFVHVRGGAYFLLPGLRALKYLSEGQP